MKLLNRTVRYLDREQRKRTTHEIMLFIIMVAIFMFFLPLIIKLLLLKNTALSHALPNEFGLSTLVLLGGSLILYHTKGLKEKDNHRRFRQFLIALLIAGVWFLSLQFFGWRKVFFDIESGDIRIIAVIVIYHSLHLIVAMGMLLALILKMRSVNSASDHYIYFLNPAHNQFYKTMCNYWDYIGCIWVALYSIMLIKFL